MKKDKFYIDFPDEDLMDEEIKTIVTNGMPKENSFCSYLVDIYKQVGFNQIFRDKVEIMYVISLMLLGLLFVSLSAHDFMNFAKGRIYIFVFASSPLIYFAIFSFSFVKAKQNKTYEVEMICKYNVFQMTAFRMFAFSMLCLVLNAGFISLLTVMYHYMSFLQAIMISTISLFLFASFLLFMITKVHTKIMKYIFILGWLGINYLLFVLSSGPYQMNLVHIPLYIYVTLIVLSLWMYIRGLKNLVTLRTLEGVA